MDDTSKIKTVVFDLGGVLIDWNPRYLYRKIFDSEERVEWFLSEVCTQAWHEQQDAGRPPEEAVRELTSQHPDLAPEIRAFYDRAEEMLAGPIHETVGVLSELRDRDCHLLALSNWPAETFPPSQAIYDFLDWFDGLVISGREKMMKPDPEIFRLLLDRYELQPSETLFIDDMPHNVEAASALGIAAHRFLDAAQLRSTLVALDLLHASE